LIGENVCSNISISLGDVTAFLVLVTGELDCHVNFWHIPKILSKILDKIWQEYVIQEYVIQEYVMLSGKWMEKPCHSVYSVSQLASPVGHNIAEPELD